MLPRATAGKDCFIMDPNPIDLRVGGRLRARRRAVGMGPEKLAQELGVSLQQVIAWELGVTRIGPSWLFKIAKVLDVSSSYFFGDSEPPLSRLH